MLVAKIFLTNLGKYNEGSLVGEWVELPTENGFDEILERIGINERYEEYFITDYTSYIEGFEIDEYENIYELDKLCEEISLLNEDDEAKLNAILEAGLYSTLQEAFDNLGRVEFIKGDPDDILDDMVEDTLNDITYGKEIPDILTRYFDYKAFKHDLMYDYTVTSYGLIWNY